MKIQGRKEGKEEWSTLLGMLLAKSFIKSQPEYFIFCKRQNFVWPMQPHEVALQQIFVFIAGTWYRINQNGTNLLEHAGKDFQEDKISIVVRDNHLVGWRFIYLFFQSDQCELKADSYLAFFIPFIQLAQ